MWALKRPSIDDVRSHMDTALEVAAPGAPALASEEEKGAIEELYRVYEQTGGRPSDALLGGALRPELLQSIHDAYGLVQDNRKLSHLRSALKLNADQCPYCGFGEIQDLDHHLQKAIYKAFSIFPLNLVPSCTTCNRGKKKKPSTDPAKQLLNVYLEDPREHHFLIARVAIAPDTGAVLVEFEVRQRQGLSDELFARLQQHLKEFRLNIRLRKEVNLYLCALEVSLNDSYGSGGATGVEVFLRRSSRKSADRFGVNDWRTALLTGLAECAEFCDGGFLRALGR